MDSNEETPTEGANHHPNTLSQIQVPQSLLKASYSESEGKCAADEDNNDGSGTADNVSDELDQYMVGSMLTTRLSLFSRSDRLCW